MVENSKKSKMEAQNNFKGIFSKSPTNSILDAVILLPYTVPADYFNVVPDIIVKKATIETSKISKRLELKYSLPDDYFDNFSNQMIKRLSGITIENELSSVAPSLSAISRNVHYHIPDDYFEKSLLNVETKSKQNARIIPFKIIKQFLAAAVVIGVITIGIFELIHYEQSITNAYHPQELSAKPTINMLSDDELTKYINNDYLAYSSETVILDDATIPDIKQNVEVVSDEDLDTYLQDAATNTTVKKGI